MAKTKTTIVFTAFLGPPNWAGIKNKRLNPYSSVDPRLSLSSILQYVFQSFFLPSYSS